MNARPVWPSRCLLIVAVLLPLLSFSQESSVAASRSDQPKKRQPDADRPARLVLEDPLQPLVERRPRNQADEDRLEALILFSAGRAHQQRKEYAAALRYYQRALRCDPRAVPVARLIIPLAFRLNQRAVAVRYAFAMARMEEADPLLLRNLGVFLSQQGDWKGAAVLYEKALAAVSDDKDREEDAADILLKMEMGRIYHLLEKFDKAAECFERVLFALDNPEKFKLDESVRKVLLGDAAATYGLLGECFLMADRPDDAAAVFEKSQQVHPDKARQELNIARVCAKKKQYKQALDHLEAGFKEGISETGALPYRLLAEVLEGLDKKDELTARLVKLHESDSENHPLGYYLAGCYLDAEQFDKAEPLYAKLLKDAPTLTAYRSLARIYRKSKRTEDLLSIIGDAAGKTGILGALGDELEAIRDDNDLIDELEKLARKKLQAKPQQLDHGMRLAIALLALDRKQFDTAAEFLNLAIQSEPDQTAELLMVWGVALLLDERAGEAVKVFQRGIDEKVLPDDNPAFWFYLAGALELDGRTDDALSAARKAAHLKEELPRFAGREAWILYHAKRNDEAIEAYSKLIEKFDGDHKSSETRQVLRRARLALSALCALADRNAEAEEWLQRILDEFPDDIGANNDLGYLWADQGIHLSRAERMIRKAVEAEPDNPAYRDSLGWVLFRLGRNDEAIAELEKAAAADKPDAVILDHLGDAYAKSRQDDKARESWRRAVKAFREEGQEDKTRQVEKKINSNVE